MRNGYILEHRLVMEGVLGRRLRVDEVVHHLNGDKLDNSPANLEVLRKHVHDRMPKPPIRPITCPHCGGSIRVSGRVRQAGAD
jgi:hypothetical protein